MIPAHIRTEIQRAADGARHEANVAYSLTGVGTATTDALFSLARHLQEKVLDADEHDAGVRITGFIPVDADGRPDGGAHGDLVWGHEPPIDRPIVPDPPVDHPHEHWAYNCQQPYPGFPPKESQRWCLACSGGKPKDTP